MMWLVVLFIGIGAQSSGQAVPDGVRPPIFRGGTYVVPVTITLEFNKKPWVGLTAADFVLLLDKKPVEPPEVAADAEAPNRYTMYFRPPDAARDGKTHEIQVKVKRPKSKNWTTLPMKMPVTLAKMSVAALTAGYGRDNISGLGSLLEREQ